MDITSLLPIAGPKFQRCLKGDLEFFELLQVFKILRFFFWRSFKRHSAKPHGSTETAVEGMRKTPWSFAGKLF
jgi:hypothetical protein